MKQFSSPAKRLLRAFIAVAIVVSFVAWWKAGRAVPAASQTQASDVAPVPAPLATAPAPAAPTAAAAIASGKRFDWFQARPFAAAIASGQHEWTAEDGRDPDAILNLAHNDAEVQRLMEENARIGRRQLVYRSEPAWVLVERAKAAGEPLRKLMLPAFDGRELEMEVTRADLAPSGLSGTFAGRIAGRGQSMVTLAFDKGREAFTVMSPEDGTYLQGHPREPGEIILTSFEPDKYQPLPGGEPIRTNQTFKIAQ